MVFWMPAWHDTQHQRLLVMDNTARPSIVVLGCGKNSAPVKQKAPDALAGSRAQVHYRGLVFRNFSQQGVVIYWMIELSSLHPGQRLEPNRQPCIDSGLLPHSKPFVRVIDAKMVAF
jgi:hypothetical protein